MIAAYWMMQYFGTHLSTPRSPELLSSVGDQLGELWVEVALPHAAIRSKMLAALTRPFDEASNNAGPGRLGTT